MNTNLNSILEHVDIKVKYTGNLHHLALTRIANGQMVEVLWN